MPIKNFDPFDFKKKKIAGVNVYYKNLPWAPCIHIYFSFAAGAFTDPVGKEGTAHFLEHLLGNGSPLAQDKKAVKEYNRLYMLNTRNAYTSHYQTVCYCKCLPENFDKAFALINDNVFNPFIRPEDVEHERKVITQESWGRYKNEKFLSYVKKFDATLFKGHQRARINSPLGWPNTIAKISHKDLKDFHTKHYNKENLSIFLAGAIQEKDLKIIEKIIENAPKGKKNIINVGSISKPTKLRNRINSADIGDPQKQATFSLSRTFDKKGTDKNWLRVQIRMFLYDVLFERLRIEHSLSYGVRIMFSNYKDYVQTEISVDTSVEKIPLVEKEIWKVLKEIDENKWQARFETMHKLTVDQIKSTETDTHDIIDGASVSIINENRIRTLKERISEVQKISYGDIKKELKYIFNPKYTHTEIILPDNK
ncbi:MAG: pitrilysin family protein [Minisyncoccia bacterium]